MNIFVINRRFLFESNILSLRSKFFVLNLKFCKFLYVSDMIEEKFSHKKLFRHNYE
jgi:hypothetical protein